MLSAGVLRSMMMVVVITAHIRYVPVDMISGCLDIPTG